MTDFCVLGEMSKPVGQGLFYDILQDEEQQDGDSTEEIKLEPEDMHVDDTLEDNMSKPIGQGLFYDILQDEEQQDGDSTEDIKLEPEDMHVDDTLEDNLAAVTAAVPSRLRLRARRLDVPAIGLLSEDSDSLENDDNDDDDNNDDDDDDDDDDVTPLTFDRQTVRARRLYEVELLERAELTGTVAEEREDAVDTDFRWSEDFSSFTGQRETYQRQTGPTFSSQEPAEIFLQVWDEAIVTLIASETNRYARHYIEQLSDPSISPGVPKYLESWDDITMEKLYRYFAAFIFISVCHWGKLQNYWTTGVLGMPDFRAIISRKEFQLITKFLHFVNDECTVTLSRHDRKLRKIAPVLEHCNERFSSLYAARQHLSLGESLPLWKDPLSWEHCVRTKAARCGIKSYDLCEAETGYLLRTSLYTGKESAVHPELIHGFGNETAKLVLKLVDGFLDVGHTLVMDNRYNQLALTRFLKSRGTDVLGTMSRARLGVPAEIKDLNPTQMRRGEVVSRNCGDIALVAWKDVKLVTVISTYHTHQTAAGGGATGALQKPVAVEEYNRYMGSVDLKDYRLSPFIVERKRPRKWYMEVFRKLINSSLLNAYIIYGHNHIYRVYTPRQFRMKVAEGLLARFPRVTLQPPQITSDLLRLQPGSHFPEELGKRPSGKTRQRRCMRCNALADPKRRDVKTMCKLCKVALCIGKCWEDYHTRLDLSAP